MRYKVENDRLVVNDGVTKTTLTRNLVVQQQSADGALHNAKVSRETTDMRGPGAGRHIGDMPYVTYMQMVKDADGDEDKLNESIRRWFMNPDNAHFRAWGKW